MKKLFIFLVILASGMLASECEPIKNLTDKLDITCKDGRYGLSFKNDKNIIPHQFKLLKDFEVLSNGLIYIREYDNKARSQNKNLLCYLIDKNGRIIHKSRFFVLKEGVFDKLWILRDEYTPSIENGTSKALLDKNGNFLVPLGKYLNISLLSDKNKIYVKKRDYKHYLQVSGYDSFRKKEDNYGHFLQGIIRKNGKEIIPPIYYKVNELDKDTVVAEGINDAIYLFDGNGKLIFKSDKYKRIQKGLNKDIIMATFKDEKVALIDKKTQNILLELKKGELITPIVSNAWRIGSRKNFKVINQKMQIIVDSSKIDSVKRFNSLKGFGNLMSVGKGDKKGIITSMGKVVAPLKYRSFYQPKNDTSWLKATLGLVKKIHKGGQAIYFAHENKNDKNYDIYCYINNAKIKDYKKISKILSNTSHKRFIFDKEGNVLNVGAYRSVKIISPSHIEIKKTIFSKTKVIDMKGKVYEKFF